MSRPRFLADHDFSEHILRGLLRLEPTVEVLRLRELQLESKPDADILEYAARESWIVLSHDVNTMSAAANERLASRQIMRGLILAKQTAARAKVIDDLLLLWTASEAEEWSDRVLFLPW